MSSARGPLTALPPIEGTDGHHALSLHRLPYSRNRQDRPDRQHRIRRPDHDRIGFLQAGEDPRGRDCELGTLEPDVAHRVDVSSAHEVVLEVQPTAVDEQLRAQRPSSTPEHRGVDPETPRDLAGDFAESCSSRVGCCGRGSAPGRGRRDGRESIGNRSEFVHHPPCLVGPPPPRSSLCVPARV
jgi:hypothetical protein